MDERIALTDGRLELVSGGRTRDVAAARDFVRLVQAFPADALFHGEESYYLGFLGDRVWVIPYFTPGIGALLELVAPALAARGALFRAEVAGCPLPWRRRLLGLLPLFPTPALGSHPLRTTPAFVSRAEYERRIAGSVVEGALRVERQLSPTEAAALVHTILGRKYDPGAARD